MNERLASVLRGRRGEWYFAAQVFFMALVLLGPRTLPSLPSWPAASSPAWVIAGGILILLGGGSLLAAIFHLRRNLTPLPYPTAGARLVQSGPYAIVRHPMYSSGLVMATGWALAVRGWLTVLYVVLLFIFMLIKTKREERWLGERFPEYADYQQRVRRLIPLIC